MSDRRIDIVLRVRGDLGAVRVDRRQLVAPVLRFMVAGFAVASVAALAYSISTGERWAQGFGFALSTAACAFDALAWRVAAHRLALMVATAVHGRERGAAAIEVPSPKGPPS